MLSMLFFLFYIFILSSSFEELTCPALTGGVSWPETRRDSCTYSKAPLCLNDNFLPVKKCCLGEEWEKPSTCQLFQKDISPCPDGFMRINQFCVLFVKGSYPVRCPYEEQAQIESVLDGIELVFPIWLPARRISPHPGLGIMYWDEISSDDYMTSSCFSMESCDSYYFEDSPLNKDCLIFHNRTYIEAVDCKRNHTGICVYKILKYRQESICNILDKNCYQSSFKNRSECFCIVEEQDQVVEFLEPYQNFVVPNCNCFFGLVKKGSELIWIRSERFLNYSNWVQTYSEGDFVFLTEDGWVFSESNEGFYLNSKRIDLSYNELDFFYEEGTINLFVRNLRVSVKDCNWIHCFTDCSDDTLIAKITIIQENCTMIAEDVLQVQFGLHVKGPGHYWCELSKYTNPFRLTTDRILVRSENVYPIEFVAFLETGYIRNTDPLTQNFLTMKMNLLQLLLSDCVYNFQPRIFQIVSINEIDRTVILNVHFTSRTNLDLTAALIEIRALFIDSIHFLLLKLLSADYCEDLNENDLTWPKTKLNTTVYPEEICVSSDLEIVNRKCSGNFVEGAKWESLNSSCIPLIKSAISDELYDWLQINQITSGLNSIQKALNQNQFEAVDLVFLYIATETLLLQESIENEFKLIMTIFDEILGIDPDYLKQKLPPELLGLESKLLKNLKSLSSRTSNSFYLLFNNFILYSFKFPEEYHNSTLIFDKASNDLTFCTVNCFSSSKDMIIIVKNIPNSSILKILLYLQSKPFTYKNPQFEKVSFILEVAIYDQHFNLQTMIKPMVYFKNTEENATKLCVSFKDDSIITEGIAVSQEGYDSCQLAPEEEWTVWYKPTKPGQPENATKDLEDILNSNDSMTVKMENLKELTHYSNSLQSIDISLIAQILFTAAKASFSSLECIAVITNNLIQVQEEILKHAQIIQQCTDRILRYIDEILINNNETDPFSIQTKQFILNYLRFNSSFYGLVLKNCKKKCSVQILKEDYLEGEFDAAVIFSPELLDQISGLYLPKIIISVFLGDSLFVEKEKKQVNKMIFSILLPDLEELDGNITVIYKDQLRGQSCVYWKYNVESGKPKMGSWEYDHDPIIRSKYYACSFRHVTHFGLLLTNDRSVFDRAQYGSLDIMTDSLAILSFLGIFGIFLTAFLFSSWRSNTGNQILLNFTVAISVKIILLYVSEVISHDDDVSCIVIGVLLHYSLLSEFCWMLIIAILQFKRFVEVLGPPPKNILIKANICGWVFPLVPIVLIVTLDRNNYCRSEVGLCYPTNLGLYLGVWLPTILILAINIVIFCYIMYNVCHKDTGYKDVGEQEKLFQWVLALLLFFMLGLTWVFGFLAVLDIGPVFVYLFCICSTLQGFVMFLFFVVLNKEVRNKYWKLYVNWKDNKRNYPKKMSQ